jgi:hypothetical protein
MDRLEILEPDDASLPVSSLMSLPSSSLRKWQLQMDVTNPDIVQHKVDDAWISAGLVVCLEMIGFAKEEELVEGGVGGVVGVESELSPLEWKEGMRGGWGRVERGSREGRREVGAGKEASGWRERFRNSKGRESGRRWQESGRRYG